MGYFTWIDADGRPRVTYLIDEAKHDEVIAKLKREGHMPRETVVIDNGPIPSGLTVSAPPSTDPVKALEARVAALEAKPSP